MSKPADPSAARESGFHGATWSQLTRGSNVLTGVVVNDASDNLLSACALSKTQRGPSATYQVGGHHNRCAKNKRLVVVLRTTHLCDHGEECRCTSIRQDDAGNGGTALSECGVTEVHDTPLPWAFLGRLSRSVLHADGDGHDDDCDQTSSAVARGYSLAVRIDTTPTQPSPWIRPRVWIEAMSAAATAATATKMAVHAPCIEMALRATERESMPAPATKVMTAMSVTLGE